MGQLFIGLPNDIEGSFWRRDDVEWNRHSETLPEVAEVQL